MSGFKEFIKTTAAAATIMGGINAASADTYHSQQAEDEANAKICETVFPEILAIYNDPGNGPGGSSDYGPAGSDDQQSEKDRLLENHFSKICASDAVQAILHPPKSLTEACSEAMGTDPGPYRFSSPELCSRIGTEHFLSGPNSDKYDIVCMESAMSFNDVALKDVPYLTDYKIEQMDKFQEACVKGLLTELEGVDTTTARTARSPITDNMWKRHALTPNY